MHIYSDMTPTLQLTGDGNVKKLYDIDVVVQSIKTILSTVSGERVRNPIGARVVRLLFQPMSADLARLLRTEIVDTLVAHEPRVDIENFSIIPNYDGNFYEMKLLIRVKGIRNTSVVNYRMRSFAGSNI